MITSIGHCINKMHIEYWEEDVTDATVRKIGMFITSRSIKLIAASLQPLKRVLSWNKNVIC